MYFYIKSEPGVWTVGLYDREGRWVSESDWDCSERAAMRVNYLNGGDGNPQPLWRGE